MSELNKKNNFDNLRLNEQLTLVLEKAETSKDTHKAFVKKISNGRLVESNNSNSHVIVCFIPYDVKKNMILLVHNIATDLWLTPAAHVHDGENLIDTVKREAYEELGLRLDHVELPFLLTLTKAKSKKRPHCKQHFDVWFIIRVKPKEISINKEEKEASDYCWEKLDSNFKDVSDPATIIAIEALKKRYLSS